MSNATKRGVGSTGWDDAELLATASEFAGVGSDAGLDRVDRFRAAMARLVGKYCAREAGAAARGSRGLSVFLLYPAEVPDIVADACKRVTMLDRAREPLGGRIWFVNHVGSLARWCPGEFESDDDLFRFVTDDLGLGSVPAVIVDDEDEIELRFYPDGLSRPDKWDRLHPANAQIPLDEILRVVEGVYRKRLVTPATHPTDLKVWADARTGTPVEHAERVLASVVLIALQGRFSWCDVDIERPLPAGRIDIVIDEPVVGDVGTTVTHAILELKVLRSRSHTGRRVGAARTAQAIEDGVVQAAAYRTESKARAAALCCFDMRDDYAGSACFAPVEALASRVGIELRHWHLFRNAKAWRNQQLATGALDVERNEDAS
ncbi:MAG TPA: hypothetical protein VNQ77_19140 [Frankiaceae bacterium]|nr:hypothetical protein [Frankiaceae bacterium]